MIDADLALVDAGRAARSAFLERPARPTASRRSRADPARSGRINLLTLAPGRVLMSPTATRAPPSALARRGRRGASTIPYDELQKNGGGVHCSTMELVREPAG